jgi:hypothetical protein
LTYTGFNVVIYISYNFHEIRLNQKIILVFTINFLGWRFRVMVFSSTFNNISVISVSFIGGGIRSTHWQTVSHNVSTLKNWYINSLLKLVSIELGLSTGGFGMSGYVHLDGLKNCYSNSLLKEYPLTNCITQCCIEYTSPEWDLNSQH